MCKPVKISYTEGDSRRAKTVVVSSRGKAKRKIESLKKGGCTIWSFGRDKREKSVRLREIVPQISKKGKMRLRDSSPQQMTAA